MIHPRHLKEKEKQVEKNEVQTKEKGIVLQPLKSKWKPNIGAKETTASNSGLTDKEKESIPVEQSDKDIDSPNEIPKDHSNINCNDRIKAANDVGQDRTEDENNLKQLAPRKKIDGELPMKDDLNQQNNKNCC
ncbi:OLC1v1005355C1 [Oldenlandia corymbosa var. corymbosa]|uniref:OLC1v1005355C1 n=1 Tax=Oldenlandia corymbosa var. corymbosa TaxID=529605 RepID=A0AAV1DHU4_OLDCO|nr:OLC1v1005355C1 [Oldenlandia corymbosa var. corymbosa]